MQRSLQGLSRHGLLSTAGRYAGCRFSSEPQHQEPQHTQSELVPIAVLAEFSLNLQFTEPDRHQRIILSSECASPGIGFPFPKAELGTYLQYRTYLGM